LVGEKHVQFFLADSKTISFCGLAKAKSVHLVGRKHFQFLLADSLTIFISPGCLAESKSVYGRVKNTYCACLLPDSNTNWPGKKQFSFLLAGQKSYNLPIGQEEKFNFSYWPGKKD
jgi:hypothetical protein